MSQQDVHNRDGNIVRVAPVGDGFVEVELDFVAAKREDALLYAIAAFHLAFGVELGVSYVYSSPTFKQVVLRADDFTAEAARTLARAVERVRARSGVLFGRADDLFYDRPCEVLATSTDPDLDRFKGAELEGREFVEAVAAALGPDALALR